MPAPPKVTRRYKTNDRNAKANIKNKRKNVKNSERWRIGVEKEKNIKDILIDCVMLLRGDMDYKGSIEGAEILITNWEDYHIIRLKNGDVYRIKGRHITLCEIVTEG